MFESEKTYGISNLNFRGRKIDVDYTLLENDRVATRLRCTSPTKAFVRVSDEHGEDLALSDSGKEVTDLEFDLHNFGIYTVTLEPADQD